jgi:hypothetical protein
MRPTTLASAGFGRNVGLRLAADEVDGIRAVLPYWWADADVTPERVWEVPSPAAARLVIGELELWIAEHARDRIFVHAAVVAIDGRAIVLPGRSLAGKTTLCAALLAAGAEYLSDEYAALDRDGLVHPYPRPLALREDDERRYVTARALGARTVDGPLPVGLVATVRHDPGAPPSMTAVSPAAGVLDLLDNTVAGRSRPVEALDALGAAVAGAVVMAGTRGDAHDAATFLLDRLARAAQG